ncbi:1,25-dihydroxyvitamin D(3) 24-hydroxylase, mitochondrial-like [Ptychodera flava]|uniref:1,25-dihydroxyvitamin D(3) 24-hydroxylase, mitochondrial-like n=1 Tax=Ptychodera flava TaxID=63121 RepID=UPI003969C0E0
MRSSGDIIRRAVLSTNRLHGARSSSLAQAQLDRSDADGTAQSHDNIKPFDAIPGPPSGVLGFILGFYNNWKVDGFRRPWQGIAAGRDLYGPIFKSGLGVFKAVNLFDPRDVEKVLRQEGKYPRRLEFTPWVAYREHRGHSRGVLLFDGADWHRHRSALSKRMLRPKAVSAYTDTVNEVVTDLVTRFRRKGNEANNYVISDIENDLFKYAMDAAGSVLFDSRLSLLDDNLHPEAEAFIRSVHVIFEEFIYLIIVPIKYHKMFNTKSWRNHTEAWDCIFSHAKKLIDAKLEKVKAMLESDAVTEEEADFITYLVLQGKIDTGEIYANMTELLAAAVDTTSNSTLWCLYELARHPEVQEKLFEEIERVIPEGEVPNTTHINKMPYLKASIKETLRIYPPAISVSRRLDHDVVVRGYNIPAEELINLQVMHMCRDPSIFTEPMKFMPERWSRQENDVHAFAALPFGFGPRMCLGRRLAELEMHLLVARIIKNFRLENLKEVEPVMTSLITPSEPTRLRFIPRDLDK